MKLDIKIKDSNIDKILKTIVIYVDTRESNNKSITDFFDKKGIKWERKKLDYCDYSAYVPKNEELGIPCDFTLENLVCCERKASGKNGLCELAGNLTGDRTRLENEFIRANQFCENVYLVIEKGSWQKILNGDYRSEFKPISYYHSLLSWRHKYKFHIDFIESENMASHIYKLIAMTLKKHLENS